MAIGIDTHREAHVAVAVDRLGQRLAALEFRVDERGFDELRRFALALGEPAFAIEGTGSYGASLARALLAGCSPASRCRCRVAVRRASSCGCCCSSDEAHGTRASRRSIS